MNERLEKLEQEILLINKRNQKVDLDKAWETSKIRKVIICIITYSVTACVFFLLGFDRPLINALIPVTGYFLSTLSISIAKSIWLNNFLEKEQEEKINNPQN